MLSYQITACHSSWGSTIAGEDPSLFYWIFNTANRLYPRCSALTTQRHWYTFEFATTLEFFPPWNGFQLHIMKMFASVSSVSTEQSCVFCQSCHHWCITSYLRWSRHISRQFWLWLQSSLEASSGSLLTCPLTALLIYLNKANRSGCDPPCSLTW